MTTPLAGRGHRTGRLLALAAGLLAVATAVVVVGPRATPAARADAAGQGGDYVPLSPVGRLLDTRNGTGTGGATRPLGPGETLSFPVLGQAGVPATGVRAVLVDVAPVGSTANTHLDLWPDGTAKPGVSMVNALAGQTISNSAVVAVGANGRIDVLNAAGSTHVVVDVHGYFTAEQTAAGGGFVPVAQTRMVDTRHGLGATGPIAPGGSVIVTLTTPPVPATASAVFANVLVPAAGGSGFLSAFPQGGTDRFSLIDFVAGNTASGAALTLSTDGRVTFVNHSKVSVNLVVDVQGYFTASSTEGAGQRTSVTRLVDTRINLTSLEPNATTDLPIAGRNGVPTRGVAGAILNVVTTNHTGTQGFVRAWSPDEPEPSTSLANFTTGSGDRAENAVVRTGADGTVRIRNVSDGRLDLVVDLQGWFALPVPAVPVEQFAPTAVVQRSASGGVGAIEFAYVDNTGRLFEASTLPDFSSGLQWNEISGDAVFTGRLGLAEQADGRLQMFAHNTDSNVWVNRDVAQGSSAWVDAGGSLPSHASVARMTDGRLVAFAVDADGRLWTMLQDGSNGDFPDWYNKGLADLAAPPVAVPIADDHLRLVAVDRSGAVRVATFGPGAQGGVVSPWTDLGGSGFNGQPAVVSYPGSKVRIFVRAADGAIMTKMQDTSGAFPEAWDQVGTFHAAGAPSALLSPGVNAKPEVVARGTDGTIYSTGEVTQASGTWRDWVPTPATNVATDPTSFVFTNSQGETWGFVARDSDDQLVLVTVAQSLSATSSGGTGGVTFTAHALPAPSR